MDEIVAIRQGIEKFLSISDDIKEIASMHYPNLDSWEWVKMILTMQKTMEHKMIHTTAEGNAFIKYSSDETDKILIALSKSQEDFAPLKSLERIPHYRSEYSTLADIFESCMLSLKTQTIHTFLYV